MTGRTFIHKDFDAPSGVRSDMLISSVRILPGPRHAQLIVFNRGGNAGHLTVEARDAEAIARRLLGPDFGRELPEGEGVPIL